MKYVIFILLTGFLLSCSSNQEEADSPRYVITSPEVGEIVYLLQGADNIVGVTEEINFSDELRNLPKVGQFGAVSREKIIALNPSIVFTSGLEQEFLAYELNKIGIKTVIIYPQSIGELISGIREIGEYLEIEERGRSTADSLQRKIEEVRYRGNYFPRVYIEIYGNPIMSVSQSSFIGEVIELAGGSNIFQELPRDYSRIRAEDVIHADPEIIILTYPGVSGRNVKVRKGWQQIAACRADRIYDVDQIDPDLILRAGPRVVEGIKELKKIFHEK